MRSVCVALAFALICCPAQFAQGQTGNNDTALLRLRIDTGYDDSDASVGLIEAVVAKIPPVYGILEQEETPSHFILRNYGFGASNLPKSFAIILSRFLMYNHWARPEQAKAGRVLMPALPHRATINFSRSNPWNSFPKISEFSQTTALRSAIYEATDLVFGSRKILDQYPTGSRSAVMDLPDVPLSVVEQVVKDPVLSRITKDLAQPIDVHLASEMACNASGPIDHPVLSEQEKMQIAQLLAQQYQREGILFVVDTGWPNEKIYNDSRPIIYNTGLPLEEAVRHWFATWSVSATVCGAELLSFTFH